MKHNIIICISFISLIYCALPACTPLPTPSTNTTLPLTNTKDPANILLSERIENSEQAFKKGEYPKAASIFQRLTEDFPSEHHYAFLYAESLRLSGKYEEAILQYDKLLALNTLDIPALEGKGLALLVNGDITTANAIFSSIIRQDATRWRTINALGITYALQKQPEEAEKYYDMALSISNDNPAVLNNIGLSLLITGDTQAAITTLEEALEVTLPIDKPKRKQIELNLALAYGLSGHMEAAEQLLKKHLKDTEIYNNLGLYAKLNNNPALAQTYLSKALASSPVYYEKAWQSLEQIKSSSILIEEDLHEDAHVQEGRKLIPVLRPRF